MNIQQFENFISKTYITRGKKYYRDGHVFALKQISPTAWRADVEGTEDYFVFVELEGQRITLSVCNCPFDGPYCKHEVAVYYEIREALAKRQRQTLPEAVRAQSKDELLALLEQMIQDYPTLQSYFTKTEPVTKPTKNSVQDASWRISQSMDEFSDYYGQLYEDYTEEAFRGFYDVLDEAQGIVIDDPVNATRLLLICSIELMAIRERCEEEPWDELSTVIDQHVLEVMAEIQEERAAKEVTALLIAELESVTSKIEDYRFVLNMLIELSPFAQSRTQIEQLLAELPLEVEERTIFQLDLLLRLEADDEIANYYIVEVLTVAQRERLIDYAIMKDDVDAALLLCANGIDQLGVDPFYKRQWLIRAFTLHGKQNNIGAQRFIAFELAVKGEMEDFMRLKQLYLEDVELWQDVLENYLLTLEDNRLLGHYGKVLVQEEQWARLLRYCQAEPQRVLSYADVLKPHYEKKVRELAQHYFERKAPTLNSRGPYKGFAQELHAYANSGYRAHAMELKQLFERTYAKKRAFLEELQLVR